jgi:transposase
VPESTNDDKSTRPDPEVRPKRRVLTPAYKLTLLDELDAAAHGQRGEILRREAVYSSQITEWRRQRSEGSLVSGRKRGRKAADPLVAEVEELRAKVERLEAQLAIAEEIQEAQGKVSALLQQMSRKSASPK